MKIYAKYIVKTVYLRLLCKQNLKLINMKGVLFLLALLSSIACNAQFVIKDGPFTTEDGKGYIIYEFDGMTQKDLFTKTKSVLTSSYISPKDVMSTSEYETISITAYTDNICWPIKVFGRPSSSCVDVTYKITFQFKDGKIRVDSPYIINCTQGSGKDKKEYVFDSGWGLADMSSTLYLYNTKGKLRYPKLKEAAEKGMNRIIDNIITQIQNKSLENDDW